MKNILENTYIRLKNFKRRPGAIRNLLACALRPYYARLFILLCSKGIIFPNGIEYNVNGTDKIRLSPIVVRTKGDIYEPDVWGAFMKELRPNDVFADIGAHIGLYSLCAAKRIGKDGSVFAFEPDDIVFGQLNEHIKLNNFEGKVEAINKVCGAKKGRVFFAATSDSQSKVQVDGAIIGNVEKGVVSIDEAFQETRLDILKIDVEGYEEKVLLGANNVLNRKSGGPRAIFIEVHPMSWKEYGTTSEKILNILNGSGYVVRDVSGNNVEQINFYGEIVAIKGQQ